MTKQGAMRSAASEQCDRVLEGVAKQLYIIAHFTAIYMQKNADIN